jgi:hypothetical protein
MYAKKITAAPVNIPEIPKEPKLPVFSGINGVQYQCL